MRQHKRERKNNRGIRNRQKGELKFGYINIGDKGRKSIVLEEGISDEDCKAILSTIIDDAQNIFLNQE